MNMIYLRYIYVMILFLPIRGGKDVYKQSYPPVNDSLLSSQDYCDPDSNQTCPLFIAFLTSFGGIYKSNGGIPGVQIALDEINRDSSMLPGYTLHYTLKDSNCSRHVALASFYTQMFQLPTKLGVIGSGCSEATEATAEAAYFFNITQLSCFPASLRGKSSFHLLSSETNLAYGYFGIVKEFGWKRVAIITQDEKIFTQAMDVVTGQLRSYNINYTETVFLTSRGVDSLEDELFDRSARIFLLSMYPPQAREVLCKAYQGGMYYPRYQFIIPGWYGERWWVGDNATQRYLMEKYQCSVANREQVLAYSLTVFLDEFLKNYSLLVDSGNNGNRFYEEYDRLINSSEPSFNLEPTVYAQQCYDTTWTYARALNKTLTIIRENETLRNSLHQFNSELDPRERFNLQHFTYNNSAMLSLMIDNIANTDFLGLTGSIRFDNDRTKRVQNSIIRQYRNKSAKGDWEMINVAEIDFSNTSDLLFSYEEGFSNGLLWPHGQIPYDGVPVVVIDTVHIGIIIFFGVLIAGGIIFSVICLIFNFYYRNTMLMKLSSKNLNYLIGIGAILLYISMIQYIFPTTDGPTFVVLLNLNIWMISVGYYLCFGTVIMKMIRIWYIFYKPFSTNSKKTIHDWILAVGVVVLLLIELTVSSVYTIVLRDKFIATLVPNAPDEVVEIRGIIKQHLRLVVEVELPRSLTLSALEVLYLLIALILAFCTNNVKVKGLDDSRYVIVAVYIAAIAYIIYFVTALATTLDVNTQAALSSTLYFIGITEILLLTFVPKMVLLYKDPDCQALFETSNTPPDCTINMSSERRLSLRKSSLRNGSVKNGSKVPQRRATCSVLSPTEKDVRLTKATSSSALLIHKNEDTDRVPVKKLDSITSEEDSSVKKTFQA